MQPKYLYYHVRPQFKKVPGMKKSRLPIVLLITFSWMFILSPAPSLAAGAQKLQPDFVQAVDRVSPSVVSGSTNQL
jgi:hypothetical protein